LSKKLRLVLELTTGDELTLELALRVTPTLFGAKASTVDDRRNREHSLNVKFRMLIVGEF